MAFLPVQLIASGLFVELADHPVGIGLEDAESVSVVGMDRNRRDGEIGALIPMVALGIPGDAITAVMLATLTLHGITPGPRLVDDNPTLIAAIFAGFFFINLLLLPLGMLLSRVAAPILRVREAFMMTAIVILCAVGIYFVRGNVFDLLVMGGAGFVGFLLRRQGFPMAPLVIGMVLGPTLELTLRQGLILTDGSFFAFFSGHPIALVLAVAALLALCLPLIRAMRTADAR